MARASGSRASSTSPPIVRSRDLRGPGARFAHAGALGHMDELRIATPPVRGDELLDETDPHAGDDAEWGAEVSATTVAAPEGSPLEFWRGLLLGLVLSGAAWALIVLVAAGLARLLT